MTDIRKETDSLGEVNVPADKLCGKSFMEPGRFLALVYQGA